MNARADVVMIQPFAQVRVAADDMSDHAMMRARQLAQLLVLIQPADGPDPMLWLAQQMADEVVGTLAGLLGVKA